MEKAITDNLTKMNPGFKVRDVKGDIWVRMCDDTDMQGCYFNIRTGLWIFAYEFGEKFPAIMSIVEEPLPFPDGEAL